jgi:hypothetical protein
MRYAAFVEMKRLEEEAERKRKEEEEAEIAREKYAELCRHLERVSTSQGIRLKYDKPRRLNLYSRLRLGVHMASCNTVNHNSGIKTLDPRAKLIESGGELPPVRPGSRSQTCSPTRIQKPLTASVSMALKSRAFFAREKRAPTKLTPMPHIQIRTAPAVSISSEYLSPTMGKCSIPSSRGKFCNTAEPRPVLPVTPARGASSRASTSPGKRAKYTETKRGIRISNWYEET